MIAIVNVGGSNLASVAYALDRAHARWLITDDPSTIYKAEKVILPGVGSAKVAMDKIRNRELSAMMRELQQPTLGICLGMQMLFNHSEEGGVACLGILPGTV